MNKDAEDIWDEAFYEATMGEGDFEDILVRKMIEAEMDAYDEQTKAPTGGESGK